MSDSSRRRDPRNQIAAGSFLGLWSAVGWWSATRTTSLWTVEYGADPGPVLLPILELTILSLGALALVVEGTRQILLEPPTHKGYWSNLRRYTLTPIIFIASLLAYVIAIEFIGFIPSSGVFAFVWIASLGFRIGEGTPKALFFMAITGTLGGVGLIYFVFIYLIGVPLR